MTRTALYTGSFDPVTNGHVDVVSQTCRIVDRLVIGIGIHAAKAPLFSPVEKAEMLREVCGPIAKAAGVQFDIVDFGDLAIDAARRVGASLIVRGLRDGTDLDYEMQMAAMNAAMAPEIRTIFLPASPEVRFITATLVRQIAAMNGDVRPFAPATVVARLAEKVPRP